MRKGPPTSPPDPGPLATHDHQWEPAGEGDAPIIEDEAVVFHQRCMWVETTSSVTSERHDETFYGTGAECDEERSYRMEASSITNLRDDESNIKIGAGAFNLFETAVERAFIAIENSGEIISIDPDEEYGQVVIETDNWRITYKA